MTIVALGVPGTPGDPQGPPGTPGIPRSPPGTLRGLEGSNGYKQVSGALRGSPRGPGFPPGDMVRAPGLGSQTSEVHRSPGGPTVGDAGRPPPEAR